MEIIIELILLSLVLFTTIIWIKKDGQKKSEEELLKLLDKWETILYNNEDEFREEFPRFKNAYDILSFYFSTEVLKVYYLTYNGQHITDNLEMKYVLKFIRKYENTIDK